MAVCIDINSSSILGAWFLLEGPYRYLVSNFLPFLIYTQKKLLDFGDTEDDLTFGNLCSGENNLTSFTYLASSHVEEQTNNLCSWDCP